MSSEGFGLAMRWKGVLLATILPVMVKILTAIGLDFPETLVVDVINALALIGGLILFVVGEVRRRFNKKNELGKYSK